MPEAVPAIDRRGLRAGPRTRRSCSPRSTRRRPTSSSTQFAAGRPHRAQQRAEPPDGSARAAAHSGGQRRPPVACSPSSGAVKGWSGAIVTNPNCAAVVLAMALAPLRQFGIRAVMVTTMQAVSGAGYPGVPSLDILGNVIPYIGGGEEEKIESETLKILGTDGGRHAASGGHQRAGQSRAGDRRPHDDGVGRARRAAVGRRRHRRRCKSFRGKPQELRSADRARCRAIVCMTDANRPQPRLDAELGRRHDGVRRPRARRVRC